MSTIESRLVDDSDKDLDIHPSQAEVAPVAEDFSVGNSLEDAQRPAVIAQNERKSWITEARHKLLKTTPGQIFVRTGIAALALFGVKVGLDSATYVPPVPTASAAENTNPYASNRDALRVNNYVVSVEDASNPQDSPLVDTTALTHKMLLPIVATGYTPPMEASPTPRPTETPVPMNQFLMDKSVVDNKVTTQAIASVLSIFEGPNTPKDVDITMDPAVAAKVAEVVAKYETVNKFPKSRIVTISTEERLAIEASGTFFNALEIPKDPNNSQAGFLRVLRVMGRICPDARELVVVIEPGYNSNDSYISAATKKALASAYLSSLVTSNGKTTDAALTGNTELLALIDQLPLTIK